MIDLQSMDYRASERLLKYVPEKSTIREQLTLVIMDGDYADKMYAFEFHALFKPFIFKNQTKTVHSYGS